MNYTKRQKAFAMRMRRRLMRIVRKKTTGRGRVGVCLSAGIDSHAVLFCLKELDVPVTAFSFAIKGVQSTDLLVAKATCRKLGVHHVTIRIPSRVNLRLLIRMACVCRLKKKTEFECLPPFHYVLKAARRREIGVVLTGAVSDGYYGITREAQQEYDKDVQAYREYHFSEEDQGQYRALRTWAAEEFDITATSVYEPKDWLDFFDGTTWDFLNRPHEKIPLWIAFRDELSNVSIRFHIGLQCGDSQIREAYDYLLQEANPLRHHRVDGVYNDIRLLRAKYEGMPVSQRVRAIIEELNRPNELGDLRNQNYNARRRMKRALRKKMGLRR